ncbi:hypothetical protein M6B38_409270 [Iris pallida]|uniref:Uncharacterized protein n=1 Tax=Iris pallida TaxID=29817 RepID=A0AAX6FP08_IRIPA|nr:hypothetical protein M6B38_409270 [Iris pallida]
MKREKEIRGSSPAMADLWLIQSGTSISGGSKLCAGVEAPRRHWRLRRFFKERRGLREATQQSGSVLGSILQSRSGSCDVEVSRLRSTGRWPSVLMIWSWHGGGDLAARWI